MKTFNFKAWKQAVILVDMNAFFAAVEQHDHPEWRGQPIAITNGKQGTCIITSSYEARAYGVKTGMRLKEAQNQCPNLVVVPSRPHRYAHVSESIMKALMTITPDVEIFSVDEAFLDVTRCQSLLGHPEHIGWLARRTVLEASGLLCSIGISGDKTTAKFAAKLNKPNGFTVILPWEAKERLKNVPVTELCGIADGVGRFLARYGVYTCGDVAKLPISILAKRFGNIGRRIWHMCQGADPEPVHTKVKSPKSLGHGKVMPPHTNNKDTILIYLRHMSEKLGARLRQNQLQAQHYYIGWRNNFNWIGSKCRTVTPTHDGKTIYDLGLALLQQVWKGEALYQVQVTALDPQPENLQYDLFTSHEEKTTELNRVTDQINKRYGEFKIAPASLLLRSSMHNVISPAWKPSGHRQSI